MIDPLDHPVVFESGPQGERAYDIYSRFLKDGVVFINGPITANTGTSLTAKLLHLNSLGSDGTIKLYINSPGGDVDATFTILDVMEYVSTPITAICYGIAMSAAAVILSQAHKRHCLKSSSIMFHDIAGVIGGKRLDMQGSLDNAKWRSDMMVERVVSRTKFKEDDFRDKIRNDFYLNAQEALEAGVIDGIL